MLFKQLIDAFRGGNLLQQALQQSRKMLSTDHKMFVEACKSLRERDTADFSFDIHEKDKEINAYERQVRNKVLTHLVVSEGQDIQAGLGLVSVVIDIERIGDYTKNIAELAAAHPKRLVAGSLEERLGAIENEVSRTFENCAKAFHDNNTELARELMLAHKKEVTRNCDRLIDDFIREEVSDITLGAAVAAGIYTRYLKRINAHLKNIATSLVNPFERIGFQE